MILSKDISTDFKCYESIDTLPIYDFYEIINNKKYERLVISGNPSEKHLMSVWSVIFNQYFEEAGIKPPEWKEIIKVEDLKHKYNCVRGLLLIATKLDDNFFDAVEALKKWNYHIRPKEPLEKEIKRMFKGLESLYTKIQIRESSIEKPLNDAKLNIWKEQIRLKKYFKFDIDVRKTTCIEWINLNKEFIEQIENGKRSD